MEKPKQLLSEVKDIQQLLNCPKSRVYQLVRERKITHYRICGRIYFDLDKVLREIRNFEKKVIGRKDEVVVLTEKEHQILKDKIYDLTLEVEKLKQSRPAQG